VRVPHDVSVVDFDNIFAAGAVRAVRHRGPGHDRRPLRRRDDAAAPLPRCGRGAAELMRGSDVRSPHGLTWCRPRPGAR
jgi:hypothetical protein